MGKLDLHPQWMNLSSITMNGATFAQSETRTPNILISGKKIMEILKIQYSIDGLQMANLAADTFLNMLVQLTSQSQSALIGLNNALVIDQWARQRDLIVQDATAVAMLLTPRIFIHDLTDGDGNGSLYAGQSIFLGVNGSNAIQTQVIRARILYRVVSVTAEELLGIVAQFSQAS